MLIQDWNTNLDWSSWKLPPPSRETITSPPPAKPIENPMTPEEKPLLEETPEETDKVIRRTLKDTVLCEDIITDYGRRSWCDYEVNACPQSSDVFVASEKRLSQLIAQTAQRTVKEHQGRGSSESVSSETSRPSYLARWHGWCRMTRDKLQAQHPLPDSASRCQQICNAFLCPPHGVVALYLTVGLGITIAWILSWTLLGHKALYGHVATGFVLYIGGYIGARLTAAIKLPSYAGESIPFTLVLIRVASNKAPSI